MSKSLSSRAPGSQGKSHRDPRGDKNGVIKPGRHVVGRDDEISLRAIARDIANTAHELAQPDPEPADSADFAEQIIEAVHQLEHTASAARAFMLLWRARLRALEVWARVQEGLIQDLTRER